MMWSDITWAIIPEWKEICYCVKQLIWYSGIKMSKETFLAYIIIIDVLNNDHSILWDTEMLL